VHTNKFAADNLLKTNEGDNTDILCIQEPYTIQNKIVGLSKKYKFLHQEKEEIGRL